MKLYGKEVVVLKFYLSHVGLYVVRRFVFGDGYYPLQFKKSPPYRALSYYSSQDRQRKQLSISFVDISKICERMSKY
jgi:hypothetical protein